MWKALTDPELHARWWAAGDIRPVVGHRFTLDMGNAFGHRSCEVTEVDDERLLAYRFAEGTPSTPPSPGPCTPKTGAPALS
ncbi:SRPBCC family protein [Streptomyces roseoverticillatus]|uniref:SRPBCC domain-containing protein n=1 Tax=Streptomyces roseoverticillatus TaxID=66429 RepID=A0ABV3J5Y7_9ACTN